MNRIGRILVVAAALWVTASALPGSAAASGHGTGHEGAAAESMAPGHCGESSADAATTTDEVPAAPILPAAVAAECCSGDCAGCCVEAPSRLPAEAVVAPVAGARDREDGTPLPAPANLEARDRGVTPCGRGDLPPPPVSRRLLFASLRL